MGQPSLAAGAPDTDLDLGETGVNPVVVVDAPTGRGKARACLVCVAGDDVGRQVGLGDQPIDIGRSATGMSLTANDVSRRHARVFPDRDSYVIEDLGSANGTYLNGERISGPTRVRIGDRIQLGKTVIVFTHHDELEARMEQLQRLEAMGTMAGGIAHDFNNALAVIMANIDLVGDGLDPYDTMAQESLAAIRDATSSATSLAKRLLRLGNKDPLTIGVVSLAPIVEQTLRMTKRRSSAAIAVNVDLEPGLSLLGSFDEIQQILVNLYYNACDAMPGGGRIDIAARSRRFGDSEALEHHLEMGGDYVEILVRDNGCGMDATTRARLFEPFFTTKGRGRGTGLGLAMIHGSVRRHGGAIEVESTLGQGTTFRIFLHRRA